jgi:ectoine hydroxylase
MTVPMFDTAVLSQAQREHYQQRGWVAISALVDWTWLEDVEPGMGEVGFVSGSQNGPLFDLYDEDDRWVGALGDDDVELAGVEAAEYPVGAAGTITVHNCRTVHGSAPNRSARPRPLLLQTYAAADAFSYTDLVKQSPHGDELIRGKPARWARHDPRPCLMPPTGEYRPIFAVQQGEQP